MTSSRIYIVNGMLRKMRKEAIVKRSMENEKNKTFRR